MIIQDRLYNKIVRAMPIACVDLLVTDPSESILMVRRKNPPAAGCWWLPGGRVFYLESRAEAAHRKLKEECGLVAKDIRELGTYDVILESSDYISHGITTVFHVSVKQTHIQLDNQSNSYAWKRVNGWLECTSHEFLRTVLSCYIK